MKKILLLLGITALLTACASYTINGQKVSKEEYSQWVAQKVKKGIESRRFVIDVRSMHPHRSYTRQLSSPYSLELRGDSVISYLPYIGQAWNIPYGGGKGLNFIGHLNGYDVHQIKSGLWQLVMTRPSTSISSRCSTTAVPPLMSGHRNVTPSHSMGR